MIKNISSKNKIDLLHGIRNATWDIVLMEDWKKKTSTQSEQNRLHILASNDKAIKRAADKIFISYTDNQDEIYNELLNQFEPEWGRKDAISIVDYYKHLCLSKDSFQRMANKQNAHQYLEEMKMNLEIELGIDCIG